MPRLFFTLRLLLMKSVAVFCGSNNGNNPVYAQAAVATGRLIAERNLILVYGGGHRGLMGVVADAALAGGGEVIGVIPHALATREIAHAGVKDLRVVDSMGSGDYEVIAATGRRLRSDRSLFLTPDFYPELNFDAYLEDTERLSDDEEGEPRRE